MKTIKLSLFALMFISLCSCSKDESPNLNATMIVGEWNLSSFNYDGKTEMNYEDTNYTSNFSGVAENIDLTLTFNSNNTFQSKGSYDVNLTIEGYSQIYPVSGYTSSGNWSVDGNILKTTTNLAQMSEGEVGSGESVGDMIIQEITENRMVLTIDQVTKINESGFENIATISGEYVLTR